MNPHNSEQYRQPTKEEAAELKALRQRIGDAIMRDVSLLYQTACAAVAKVLKAMRIVRKPPK